MSSSDALIGDLHARLHTWASQANTARAWPSDTKPDAPYVFTPGTAASAAMNPAAHVPAAEALIKEGGVVLQLIDNGEAIAVRSTSTDDLEMAPLAHEDLWAGVHTWLPHRVPVGDRIEGVSVLGRLLMAAIEQVVVVAGFEAVQKLKVRAFLSRWSSSPASRLFRSSRCAPSCLCLASCSARKGSGYHRNRPTGFRIFDLGHSTTARTPDSMEQALRCCAC